MSSAHSEVGPAEVFAQLARNLAEVHGVAPTLEQVVAFGTSVVPCDWVAAVATDRIGTKPASLSAFSGEGELMHAVADIAARAGTSPGIDAFEHGTMVHSPDLSTEERFSTYARELVASTPIRSVLSFGLRLREEPLGIITFYSAHPHAFGAAEIERATVLADHVAIAIDAATSANQADNLKAALSNSRMIGMALGILIERHRITADEAFERLRSASQQANRKLADLAADLVRTGQFPV